MKRRKTAAILALFTGWLGVHRFYLGQPGLGVLYFILSFSGISLLLGILDAVMFLTMRDEIFDLKYNRQPYERGSRRFEREYTRNTKRRQREDRYRDRQRRRDKEILQRKSEVRRRPRTAPKVKTSRANPYKQSGVQKFKDYDYDGAIEDFKKALDINPRDIATHFNLACAYSLNEKTNDALGHLKKAISFGYNNFDNIRNHDALAYLRIQPEYEAFESSGFEVNEEIKTSRKIQVDEPEKREEPEEQKTSIPQEDNLLEQLKKLAELRQKGLLTSEQYAIEKRRLLE
ncbi:MAG: NINE protein [Bacteroidia bacterium]|nr:NINE protein [Bacteroidia bacterium]